MNPRTGCSGFVCPPNRNSVRTVGKPPTVRATSVMPSGNTKRSLVYLPLASRVAQRLLRQVRPWIEPAQSFEKNQLGLGQMFFNSLRLTWQMSLWTDSAVLLRTMVWLDTPPEAALLAGLQPRQLELELLAEK